MPVDQALRKRAKQEGKSFNQTVVDALSTQIFGTTKSPEPRIEDLFGIGGDTLDDGFDQAIADLSKVDEKFWNDPGHTRY